MKLHLILVTTPNRFVSERLSKGLIQNKLAACVNRLPGIYSRFWWKGKIETSREEILLIKTQQKKVSSLTKWIKKNHPYHLCEIIVLPILGGNRAYLNWIYRSTD